MHRTASNATVLISKNANHIWQGMYNYCPMRRENIIMNANGEFCKQLAFPNLLPNGKLEYIVPQDSPISSGFY